MCAHKRAGFGVRVKLAETAVVLNGPPIRGVSVLLGGFDELSTLEVLGSGADRRDLWVAEDRRGHPVVGEGTEIIRMSQVVGDSSRFGIRHVLEFERRAAVAQRPDTRCRPPEIVDDDVPVVTKGHPGHVQTEVVGVRPTSGYDE